MMGNLIVVIDDSITMCTIIKVCLNREGYEVLCFSNELLAVRWFGSPERRIPDLVFVDLCLPQFDGYEVIRRLRARSAFCQIPFVIISRRNGLLDKLKGKLIGAADYLIKPVETTKLLSVVRGYLGVAVPVEL